VNSAICMSDCIMAGPLAATNVFAFAPAPNQFPTVAVIMGTRKSHLFEAVT